MVDKSVLFEPATRLLERIRNKDMSALELVDAHIARIEEVNPKLNALVTTVFERARSEARAADEKLARGESTGPLHGLPVSIKDAINTADVRTVAGSKALADNVPANDAPAVARLRASGAIVLGKTNVPECAMDWRTVNPVFGRTSNPWNLEFSPGGSSGGEAAAISAGCSAGGIGSDLGGSVRVPAHFCGIVGLRPTPGRIPASGFSVGAGGSFSLANTIGPLARTVEDACLLFAVLAGFDPCDPVSVSLPQPERLSVDPGKLRVAVCADGGIPVENAVSQAIDRAEAMLKSLGVDTTRWQLPAIAEVPQVFADWLLQPSLPAHLALYQGREEAMGPLMRGLASIAKPVSYEQFIEAWAARDALRQSILSRMEYRPVLVIPVSSTPAFRHDQRGSFDIGGRRVDYTSTFGYSQLASIAGLPALAIPMGRTDAGLPVGVQLVGRPFEEPLLLAVGRLLEEAGARYQQPPI